MTDEKLIGLEVFNFKRAIDDHEHPDPARFIYRVVKPAQKGFVLCERNGSKFCCEVDYLIELTGIDLVMRTKLRKLSMAYGYLVNQHWEGYDPLYGNIRKHVIDFINYGNGTFSTLFGNGELYSVVLTFVHGIMPFQQYKMTVDAVQEKRQHGKCKGSLRGFVETAEYAREVFEIARRSIIGQDEQLKEIITRVIMYLKNPNKPPVLVPGPTGCGKTLTIETIAEITEIPHIVVGMDSPTPTGYVGTNLDVMLGLRIDALMEANGGTYPKRVLIFLDEFDKILKRDDGRPGNFSMQIQSQLLRLMQPDAELTYTYIGGVGKETVTVPFSGLVFMAGAFSFIPSVKSGKITREDLRRAGFMDELVGRMSITTPYKALDTGDYEKIMRSGSCRVMVDGISEFRDLGIKITFESDAIRVLAEMAVADASGARSLNHSLNDLFTRMQMDLLFSTKRRGEHVIVSEREVKKYLTDTAPQTEKRRLGFRVPTDARRTVQPNQQRRMT